MIRDVLYYVIFINTNYDSVHWQTTKKIGGTEINGIISYKVQKKNKKTMENIAPLGRGEGGEVNNGSKK